MSVKKSASTSPRRTPGSRQNAYFRVLIIGNATVGKTTLIHSFIRCGGNGYTEDTERTSQLEAVEKHVSFPGVSNEIIRMTVIDTAGQERHRSLVQAYYRLVNVIICTIDCKDVSTLTDLKNEWIPNAKKEASESCVWLIAINKSDIFHEPVENEKARKEIFDASRKRRSRKKSSEAAAAASPELFGDSPHTKNSLPDAAPESAENVVLKQVTIDQVIDELKHLLPGLERNDVFYTSGRYGFNVNAIFMRAIWRGLSSVGESIMSAAIRAEMRNIINDLYIEHFTSDYRTFSTVRALRERVSSEAVPELAPPRPVHLTPRTDTTTTGSGAAKPNISLAAAESEGAFVSREDVAALSHRDDHFTDVNLEADFAGQRPIVGANGRVVMRTEREDEVAHGLLRNGSGSSSSGASNMPSQSSCMC